MSNLQSGVVYVTVEYSLITYYVMLVMCVGAEFLFRVVLLCFVPMIHFTKCLFPLFERSSSQQVEYGQKCIFQIVSHRGKEYMADVLEMCFYLIPKLCWRCYLV